MINLFNKIFSLTKEQLVFFRRKKLIAEKNFKFINSDKKPYVLILIYHRAHWAMDTVCKAMLQNNFNVKILISPAMEIEESLREQELEDNYNFFKTLGYDVIKGYDFNTKQAYDINENIPDIIIYQTHWMWDYLPEYDVKYFYNKALCISIPYGFYVVNIQQDQFNQEFHNLVWLNCAETPIAKDMAIKYAKNKGKNVIVTGYPKMDKLYSLHTEKYFWKNEKNLKIIYAPHYSINTNWNVNFANFHIYYKQFYDFVRNNPSVDFAFKPHPMLKSRCIQTQTMTGCEYDKYIKNWNDLNNGIVVNTGEYLDLFKTSDAMVLDSLSFIAEYLYTQKPICFINKFKDSNELLSHFNEFGQMVIKQCYVAQSWEDIENFINEVVIKGNDPMKKQRENFYEKYLSINEGHVGEKIVEIVKKELSIK